MFIHKYSFFTRCSPEHLQLSLCEKGLGWTLSLSRLWHVVETLDSPWQSELRGSWKEWGWFTGVLLKAMCSKYSCLFTLVPAHEFLFSQLMILLCFPPYDIYIYMCVCVCVCRRPGVPGHAPPSAAVYEEPQQRDAGPPEGLRHPLATRGDLHAVLLHALPSDGVGEPQRRALQGHLTNREVRRKHAD